MNTPNKLISPHRGTEYKEPFGDNYVCPNQKHEDKVYLYASWYWQAVCFISNDQLVKASLEWLAVSDATPPWPCIILYYILIKVNIRENMKELTPSDFRYCVRRVKSTTPWLHLPCQRCNSFPSMELVPLISLSETLVSIDFLFLLHNYRDVELWFYPGPWQTCEALSMTKLNLTCPS